MKPLRRTGRNKSISLASIIRRLLPLAFTAYPGFFIAANLVGVLHGASFGVNTWTAQLFFDSVTDAVNSRSGELGSVLWMAAALGGAVVGSQVLNGLHNFMGNTFVKKITGSFSKLIHQKSARIDPVSYESPELLDDINKAQEGMANSLGLLFTAVTIVTFYVPYFLFMAVYLYTLQPVLAMSLILVFVPVAASQLIRGAVFAKLEDQAAPIRREYEYLERCICDREYFKETRILGALGYFSNLYRQTLSLLGEKTWSAEARTGVLELGMKLLTLAGYFGVLYLLFDAMLQGKISIGAFASVFASIGLMFAVMEEVISRHIGNMTRNLGTVRNFIRFLDSPERTGEDLHIDAGTGVRLINISFRYPGAEADSVKGVTFELKKGETIAIVGANGAGKTTLVKLMTGLYIPSDGEVQIGGADTRNVSGGSIYRGISAVFQKYQRYKMTLDQNIRLSDVETDSDMNVSGERLTTAAAKAELDIGANMFPQGLDTMLSREFDGIDLSGGQWQRVAIARGFYRAHNLIVLDEPTAAIDPIEETRIYNQFAAIARGQTSIIVTHRIGSAKIADRIVVMDQGTIREIGTHDELLKAEGMYAEMYNEQAQWYVTS